MKIAIVVTLFPPTRLAGLEIATYTIAEYLAKRGHEVHIITSLSKGLPPKNMEEGKLLATQYFGQKHYLN